MQVSPSVLIKTLIFAVDGEPVAVLVRGDREVNDIKLKNLCNASVVEFATPEQVKEWTQSPVGFAGPVNLPIAKVYADLELQGGNGWVAGANKGDTHLRNVDLKRDCAVTAFADLRMITESDPCPACGGRIELPKGIEVGHVFKLGTKYSESMKATFLDENGKEQLMIMGCYGIGVSRVVAACIEQNNDEGGIVFPPPLAPYGVVLLNLDSKNDEVSARVDAIYGDIAATGLDVLLDDRDERPGVKFKDADLIGAPMQLVIGGKSLARGVVEAKDRRTGEKAELPAEDFMQHFKEWQANVLAGWDNR